MPDLILHHYALSPFSEKIRAMLGYTGIPWQSVITSEMPPRPLLEPLAGGYRRIPVAQIGADVFCDTRTITTEIAALANMPELAIENCSPEIADFVVDVERNAFFACVLGGGSWALGRKVWRSMSMLNIARFFLDRIKMGGTIKVPVVKPQQAAGVIKDYLGRVESMLQADFLFGDKPNIADFAAYHCFWFVRDLGEKEMVNAFPKTNAWMDRIKAFGDGNPEEISAGDALNIAKEEAPREVVERLSSESLAAEPLLGKTVLLAPSDYAQVPTEGVLVGRTAHSWILSRTHNQVGEVHVHFPRHAYELTEVVG